MSDSDHLEGKILEFPPRPHLGEEEEESGSNPAEELRRMEEEAPLVSDIGWSQPRNPLLNTSGSGPSQLTTSFSPSPAKANDSEEPNIEDVEALKLELQVCETMFCVFLCLVTGNERSIGPSVKDHLSSISYDEIMTVMRLEFLFWLVDLDKLYFMIYQQRMRFRVATLMINLLRCAMVLIGPTGKCSREKCAEKWLIRNQLAVSWGSKRVVVFDMYHSSTKRKRARIDIPLLILLLHSSKSLKQAALEIGVSESKLKNAVKEHGYDTWSDFKFNSKNDLSEKATRSPLTTCPHDVVGSNTCGLAVIHPSAAEYSGNDTTSSLQPEMLMQQIPENGGTNHQFCFQPQNTSPSQTSDLDWLSSYLLEEANQSFLATNPHGGVISNTTGQADLNTSSDQYNVQMPYQVGNANYLAAAYSVNATTSSLQHGEMSMQQIQEHASLPETSSGNLQYLNNGHIFFHSSDLEPRIFLENANQSPLTTSPYGRGVSNTSGFLVSNESNQHNLPMSLQAANVNQCSTPSSLMQPKQVYGGTNDQLGSQTRNQQPVTTPTPETGMPDRRPVTVLAAYRKKTFKFNLTSKSTKQDLEKEVMKRVNLEVESFYLDYKDEEGRWICIGCDEDFKSCMDFARSLDRATVEMVVHLND